MASFFSCPRCEGVGPYRRASGMFKHEFDSRDPRPPETPFGEAARNWRRWVRYDEGFIGAIVGLIACGLAALIWICSVTVGVGLNVSTAWFAVAIAALALAVGLAIAKRIRLLPMFLDFAMRRRKLCSRCGYHVYGVWSKYCPECGHSIE